MKRLFTLFAFLAIVSFSYGQQTTLSKDQTVTIGKLHLTCSKGTELVKDSGVVVQCTPKFSFTFVNPKMYKYEVTAGKPVYFDKNGQIVKFTLGRDAVVEDAAGQHYTALAGYEVEFYPDGSVKRFTPKFMIEVIDQNGKKSDWPARKEVTFDKFGRVVSK